MVLEAPASARPQRESSVAERIVTATRRSKSLALEAPDTQPEPTSPLRGEIRPLTGLRIVASLWVVAFHLSFAPVETFTGLLAPLQPLVSAGWLGVDLFFVLSGFVISLTYLGPMVNSFSLRSWAVFLWARVSRIWPSFALVTVLFGGWLLVRSWFTDSPSLQGVQPELDLPHMAEQLLMVQQWHRPYFPGSSFIGPGWSVSAEWLAYCAFPVLALVFWRFRALPGIVLAALAVGVNLPFFLHNVIAGTGGFEYQWAARIAGGFIAGILVCLAVQRFGVNPRAGVIASRVAIVTGALFLVTLYGADVLTQHRGGDWSGLAVIFLPVLVGSLALARGRLTDVLGSRLLVHGGRISFAVYLLHYCVFEVVWTTMTHFSWLAPATRLAQGVNLLLVPLVLLLSHLLYVCVEEPARRWLRRVGPGRADRSRRPSHV